MMKFTAAALSAGVLVLLTGAQVRAQEGPPPLPPPVKNETMAKMTGTWTASGEMFGHKYRDVVKSRWGLNKQFLITDVTSADAKNPKKVFFEGHGVLRYDAEKDQYLMHWFDGYGSMQIFTGAVNDNELKLTSKGDKRTEQLTFTLGKGSYKLVMDAAEGSGALKREWETTYTKMKTAPAAAAGTPAGEAKPKS